MNQPDVEPLQGPRQESPIWALCVLADGRRFASADGDGRVLVWDPDSGEAPVEGPALQGPVHALQLIGDGGLIACLGEDRRLHLWDPDSGEAPREVPEHVRGPGQVTAFCIFGDGRRLVTAGSQRIILWDPADPAHWAGKAERPEYLCPTLVRSLQGVPGGNRVAALLADWRVAVLDFECS